MLWKLTKRVSLGLAGIVALSILMGTVYQFASTKIDEKKFPPIGEMIDMKGYQLHLYCTGTGDLTVVLESGLGSQCLDWTLVQRPVSEFARVCSYDRAGYGWSDESPNERSSSNMVEELHDLLAKANIPKPYLLVGHSLGGINVRLYANRYPDEVIGIILVDAAHEDQYDKIPKTVVPNEFLMMTMSRIGFMRFLSHTTQFQTAQESMFGKLPQDIKQMRISQALTSKSTKTSLKELINLEKSLAQLKSARDHLGNKPLTVITAAENKVMEGSGVSKEEMENFNLAFRKLQNDLLTKSNNTRHVFADKSDHNIPLHQPEIVIEEIRRCVEQSRIE